jgi:hypothetical protein
MLNTIVFDNREFTLILVSDDKTSCIIAILQPVFHIMCHLAKILLQPKGDVLMAYLHLINFLE